MQLVAYTDDVADCALTGFVKDVIVYYGRNRGIDERIYKLLKVAVIINLFVTLSKSLCYVSSYKLCNFGLNFAFKGALSIQNVLCDVLTGRRRSQALKLSLYV